MKQLLAQGELWDEQRAEVEEMIKVRQAQNDTAALIATVPGGGALSSLTLASRIGDIQRFATPASLANYWGLVPGCRNAASAPARQKGARGAFEITIQMKEKQILMNGCTGLLSTATRPLPLGQQDHRGARSV